MIAFVLAASLLQNPTITAGRFEMAERLKTLDVAWLECKETSVRREAVKEISEAVFGFFGGKTSATCQALDTAVALLEGRAIRPGDAITIRFASPFSEPNTNAKLLATWAYLPASESPVRIEVGRQSFDLRPGTNLEIEIDPQKLSPELTRTVEAGYLVPVKIGGANRGAYVSIVKGAAARIKRVMESSNESAGVIGTYLSGILQNPGRLESDMPLIQYLFVAEQLHDGRAKVADFDAIPLAKQGNTYLRAEFPKAVKGLVGQTVNVVIALHGAGGSENMFFESYGRGMAAKEALKRGWVFISPRTGATAVEDSLAWLTQVRMLKVGRLFVIGHSMGGGVAFSSAKVTPKPSALALLAPAGGSAVKSLLNLPIFLAIGKQEMNSIRQSLQSLAREWAPRKDFEYKEYDPCEHLMVVTDALPDVYAFFDRFAKSK